jgi:competence ComEA-like helix-hairpin-helix protein
MVLTAAERKLLLLVIGLLVLGTLDDAWRMDADGRRLARMRHTGGAAPALADSFAASDSRAARPADPPAPPGRPLDLNRATLAELDALPGIGPVTARRILDHRARYGPFRDPRDLRAVKGIGPKLFARLEPLVAVDPAPRSP